MTQNAYLHSLHLLPSNHHTKQRKGWQRSLSTKHEHPTITRTNLTVRFPSLLGSEWALCPLKLFVHGAYGFCDWRFAFNISSTNIWCVWTCMRWKSISNSGSNRVHACMKLTYMSIACWLLWEFNGNAWRAFRHLCEPPPICTYTSRLFACGYLQF